MKISQLLSLDTIKLDLAASNKNEVIDQLVDVLWDAGKLTDKNLYKEEILKRESLSSTGIGERIAIPHAKTKAVKNASLALGLYKNGVDYDSLDGEPVNIVFMIAAPAGANDEHLETLSRLSVLLMNPDFKNGLLNAKTPEEVISLLDKFEENEESDETQASNEAENNSNKKYILAVTACPTGIAHTYMAADSLNKTAKEMDVHIKVETNGSTGVKNRLTQEDIDKADGIIVAADKQVEMARFNGKKVVIVPVVQAMKRPQELINEALSGSAPVYSHSGDSSNQSSGKTERRGFYKHLMNGVSNMLPFVVAGGILIAVAFLIDTMLGQVGGANFGSNTPVAATLKSIGDLAFSFMLPVLAGYIAYSIADRPALVVGFVGGAIAKDGGAGFLGALIAGFLAGYLVVGLKKLFSKLPQSLEGIKPVLLLPLFGTLLIGIIMTFIVLPPVVAINNAMVNFLASLGGTSKVLLGLVLGAMMAIDMGGPINKAAYVFGVASLDAGQYEIMAAVMAGGMVPPLAIALCTTFFKNRFTKEQRESGKVNYVMGLSFITEGAIPFAAADPLRVIPACAVGSAVAGALSMLFNASLRAPHGGIFVVPVVTNPIMYLVAIVVGSIVGMALLAVLKKPLDKEA